MSEQQTHADLERALQAHISETREGKVLTDWALIAATTTIEDIGTGATDYYLVGNTGQPVHVTLGLVAYIAAHGPYVGADDDEDEDD